MIRVASGNVSIDGAPMEPVTVTWVWSVHDPAFVSMGLNLEGKRPTWWEVGREIVQAALDQPGSRSGVGDARFRVVAGSDALTVELYGETLVVTPASVVGSFLAKSFERVPASWVPDVDACLARIFQGASS